MSKKPALVSLIFILTIICIVNFSFPRSVDADEERKVYETSDYYTIMDEEDEEMLKTGHILSTGNKYLTEDNELYKVIDVDEKENVARAEFIEEVDLSRHLEAEASLAGQYYNEQVSAKERTIGIYHSHGAESYEPSDGAESIDEGGGIIQVGEKLKNNLKDKNVDAIWSDETHVPHDAGAYSRSRRTVEELLKENPDALIDVHRDAAPREEYKVDLGFDEVVQVLLVVGQQQPNFEENKNFAESLKAVGDEKYPDFIKGILYAEGSYNQELHPRNILIEVGGHENTRENAESSASLFADVINTRLYDGEASGDIAAPIVGEEGGVGGRVARGVLWLVGLLVLCIGIFLAINYRNLNEIKNKLISFFTKEFNK